jgi:hypothetical protein
VVAAWVPVGHSPQTEQGDPARKARSPLHPKPTCTTRRAMPTLPESCHI